MEKARLGMAQKGVAVLDGIARRVQKLDERLRALERRADRMVPVRHLGTLAIGVGIGQALTKPPVACGDGSAASATLRTAGRCSLEEVGHERVPGFWGFRGSEVRVRVGV